MTIRNCFQKTGFSKETDSPIELEADAEPNIMQDKLSQLKPIRFQSIRIREHRQKPARAVRNNR
jgi:hypothetical protein